MHTNEHTDRHTHQGTETLTRTATPAHAQMQSEIRNVCDLSERDLMCVCTHEDTDLQNEHIALTATLILTHTIARTNTNTRMRTNIKMPFQTQLQADSQSKRQTERECSMVIAVHGMCVIRVADPLGMVVTRYPVP